MCQSESLEAENIKQPISSDGISSRRLVPGHTTALPDFPRRTKTINLYPQASSSDSAIFPFAWKTRFAIIIQFYKMEHALYIDTFEGNYEGNKENVYLLSSAA